ncbi:MAG: hypothetical protein HQM16_12170 [Deltaproteobacteria bacterium]|nr:hypothetical protein [Deltaproteobacteria bacterium]
MKSLKNTTPTENTYKGLVPLKENTFPKQCLSCHKQYTDLANFIANTEAVDKRASGLFDPGPKVSIPSVHLYRNCACGSTLMVICKDRRDKSEPGRKKRYLMESELITKIESILDLEINKKVEKITAQFRK